jgi:hypothetical protein
MNPGQIVTPLRQIEIAMRQGKVAQIACREAGSGHRPTNPFSRETRGTAIVTGESALFDSGSE